MSGDEMSVNRNWDSSSHVLCNSELKKNQNKTTSVLICKTESRENIFA